MHQIGSNYLYNMRIVQLPDSESVTLASDYQKKCDFSTFLEDGSILMRVAHRFCLFDSRGNFIDEVEFNHMESQAQMYRKTIKKKHKINNSDTESSAGDKADVEVK